MSSLRSSDVLEVLGPVFRGVLVVWLSCNPCNNTFINILVRWLEGTVPHSIMHKEANTLFFPTMKWSESPTAASTGGPHCCAYFLDLDVFVLLQFCLHHSGWMSHKTCNDLLSLHPSYTPKRMRTLAGSIIGASQMRMHRKTIVFCSTIFGTS